MPLFAKDSRLNHLRCFAAALVPSSASVLVYSALHWRHQGVDGFFITGALSLPGLVLGLFFAGRAFGFEPKRCLLLLSAAASLCAGLLVFYAVGLTALLVIGLSCTFGVTWSYTDAIELIAIVLAFCVPLAVGILCLCSAWKSVEVYQAPEDMLELEEGRRAVLFDFAEDASAGDAEAAESDGGLAESGGGVLRPAGAAAA